MNIYYDDDYEVRIFEGTTEVVPRIGDTVEIRNEEFRVTEVRWKPETNSVLVSMTQNSVKAAVTTDNVSSTRLREATNAILSITRRQDDQEKKSRNLSEQIGSVRKHINQRIQQDKKDSQNESR